MNSFRTIFIVILISIVTFAAFLPCLQNGFVNLEDEVYVAEARALGHLSFRSIKYIFTSFLLTIYQPISRLSCLFEYHFFKLNPHVAHLISIIIHIFNCLFTFWLIYLLTKKISLASITAILFAIHPLHVQSVAWFSDRNDLFCAFFFLAAIICYYYYLQGKRINKYYYFSLILFILSLLSKPMAITLPVILFIVDYFLNRKPDKRMFLEKIPFFLLSLIFGIVAIIAKYLSGSIRSESFLTLTDKVVVAAFGVVFYIKKILLPVKFSCIYPYYGVKDIPSSLYILAGFTIFLIAVIISSRYTRKIVFGVAFFLASILPVLQFIPINSTLVADRYAYIPSIGIFYIIALGFVWLYTKMKNVSIAKYFLLALSIIIVFTLAGLTWKRCRVWKDSLVLWSDALVSYPNLAEAYNNRGVTYYGQGDLERAISDYSKAIEMNPDDVVAYYNRASAYCDYKKPDQAIDDYDRILEINPDFADTSQKRTYLLRKKGM